MPPKPMANKFWSVKAETPKEGKKIGHLYLYGVISSKSWWGDEVTPQQFISDLASLSDISELYVHIFSDGGDYFAGNSIYAILKQQKMPVTAYVEGITASIATVVMLAAQKVYVSRNAHILIHHAMLGLEGYYNRIELSSMVSDLDKYAESMIATYQTRTGMTREQVIATMDGENAAGTWFTAQEAIDAGLADGFIPEESEAALDAVACIGPDAYRWNGINFNLSAYKNAPQITNRRSKNMPKVNKPAAKSSRARNLRAELITVTCPECGEVFEWDPSTETETDGDVTAEVYTITCPACNATFEWDTNNEPDPNEENEETTDVVARRGRKARAQKGRKVAAELLSVYCPNCWHQFTIETGSADDAGSTDAQAARKGKVRAQVYTVTCPECGEVFDCDTNVTVPAETLETVTPEANKSKGFQAGIIAERRRIAAIDTIALADPASRDIVAAAKAEGWSYQETCEAVFEDMAVRAARDPSTFYLASRSREVQNSGGMKVGSAPNSGAGGNVTASAQSQAVGMIMAGMGKNKKNGR